jgi:hypothetical protein
VKQRNLPDGYPIDEYIPRFINAEFDTRSGSWADNVLTWLALRNGWSTLLLVRYEDLKQNPQQELGRIATFLREAEFRQVDTSSEGLARAFELSSPSGCAEWRKSRLASFSRPSTAGRTSRLCAASVTVRLTYSHPEMAEMYSRFGFVPRKEWTVAIGSRKGPVDLSSDTSNWLVNLDWADIGLLGTLSRPTALSPHSNHRLVTFRRIKEGQSTSW